jgi:hypothetical protein
MSGSVVAARPDGPIALAPGRRGEPEMPNFETFDRSVLPFAGEPHVTIQRRGTLTLNAAAWAALGSPAAVELLYDAAAGLLGLRPAASDLPHVAFVRRSTRSAAGPWVVSAMAFVHHYGIDTSSARRWAARLVDGVLCVPVGEPGTVVSRPARTPTRRRRPRPAPGPTSSTA